MSIGILMGLTKRNRVVRESLFCFERNKILLVSPGIQGEKVMKLYVLAGLSIALTGCTHVATIYSENVKPLGDRQARTGVSYALPAIQYDVTLLRMLNNCGPDLKFAVTAAAKHRYVEGERFEVDPTSLSSMFKTTSLSIERYEDQNTLKSLNVAADDKTGDAVAAVARVGIAIAGTAFGLPLPPIAFGESAVAVPGQAKATGNRRQQIVCTPAAANQLKQLEDSVVRLEQLSAQLTRIGAELGKRKAVAELKSYPSESIAKLVDLAEQQINVSNDIHDLQIAQLVIQKAISFPEQTLTWPLESSLAVKADHLQHIVPFKLDEKNADKLCKLFAVLTEEEYELDGNKLWTGSAMVNGGHNAASCAAANKIALKMAEVRLSMFQEAQAPNPANGTISMSTSVATNSMNRGVFYRDPVRGRLLVELRDGSAPNGWKVSWKNEPQWIPQLGDLRFLPMSSGPFENEVLTLSLRRDGRIEKFSYETKEAAFSRAAKSAADVAEKVQAEFEKQRKTERDDEKYLRETTAAQRLDEIAKIQAQIDTLKKQKELLDQQASLTDTSAIAYRAELADLNAQIAMLTARITQLKLTDDLAEQQSKAAS